MLHIQLYRARREHARLGHLIDLEQNGRRPHAIHIAELKKRKLAVRDRIAALEAGEAIEAAARQHTA